MSCFQHYKKWIIFAAVAVMAAIAILLYFILAAQAKDPNIEEEELGAFKLLLAINNQTEHIYEKSAYFEWDYASNITDETLQKNLDYAAESAKQTKDIWHQVKQYDWKRFSDYDLKRQFMFYSILGDAALPDSDYKVLKRAVADMESTYATAKICDYHNKTKCDLELEPEMTNILANSRDEKELSHVWLEWRKAVGPKCRETYKTYVDLSNKAARLNNFTDNGDLWLFNYEDPDFKNQIQKLWDQLKPLYLQLHAYVRFKLRQKYGDGVVSEKGPIPAHLLGNMWAQTWGNIASFTLPYPEIEDIDVTSEMVKQGYTVDKIFKTAENFFTSINLTAMPDTFWKNSILIKPNDRELICHASAWDFYNKKDFRIKQCTDINVEDMTTAHHEMGHIEYYLQYKEQPITYRTGANDGFHEAIGDLIALSFSSTKHLRKIGLFKGEDDPKNVLNNLFKIGLDKIAFLPFGYMIDLWRWDVFSGKTTADNYNCKWWELREKFQGIEPPVDRSEEDFDPAGKYHVIADVPYLRYFISYVIQFQFHRALCEKAGEYEPNNPKKPLHECDIYQSTEAGNILKKMLSMGASKPWPDAMEVLTGQRKMDASGLLDYFKPLTDWLEAENQKNDVFIGWEKTKKVCVRTRQELEKPNA